MSQLNRQLGKYAIIEELGHGTFAETFRARDSELGREVALKILRPTLTENQGFVAQFQREARTLAQLRHPNILTIYEVVSVGGRICLSLELAEGGSLATLLTRRQHLDWVTTLDLLDPICAALDYMHARGVLHQDLKPSNILLRADGQPLIADFGLSRLAEQNLSAASSLRAMLGTPAYSAPELWDGQQASTASDIYALACIVYELLTGKPLFPVTGFAQAAGAHARGPVLAPGWDNGLPPGTASVLRKALAQRPGERFPSAGTFYAALRELKPAPQLAPNNRRLWYLMGATLLAVGLYLIVPRVWRGGTVPSPASTARSTDAPTTGPTLSPSDTPPPTVTSQRPSPTAVIVGSNYVVEQLLILNHEGPVNQASWNSDDTQIVAALENGTTVLWEMSGEPTRISLKGHSGPVVSAAFSPNDQLILTSSADATARIWNLRGEEMAVLGGHGGQIVSATFSPNGQFVLTASADATARIWNLQGEEVALLQGHTDGLVGASFSPDGQFILTASADETARLWDLQGRQLVLMKDDFPTSGGVISAVFSPDGQAIYTTRANNAYRWDLSGQQLAHVMNTTGPVTGVYFQPFSNRILIDSDGAMWVGDSAGDRMGNESFGLVGDRWLSAVAKTRTEPAFDRAGMHMLRGVDDELWIWTVDDRLVARVPGHTNAITSADFSYRGDTILSASADGTVRIWSAGPAR